MSKIYIRDDTGEVNGQKRKEYIQGRLASRGSIQKIGAERPFQSSLKDLLFLHIHQISLEMNGRT